VELLKDSQATTTALYRDLARAQIFHFAATDLFSRWRLLALFDKPIAADSLPYSALTRLQIAILSACNTERGLTAQKVDSQSFLRKLTAAGVPYVIASRWSVDSVTTERFMESFYDNLLAGRTPRNRLGRHNIQHDRTHLPRIQLIGLPSQHLEAPLTDVKRRSR